MVTMSIVVPREMVLSPAESMLRAFLYSGRAFSARKLNTLCSLVAKRYQIQAESANSTRSRTQPSNLQAAIFRVHLVLPDGLAVLFSPTAPSCRRRISTTKPPARTLAWVRFPRGESHTGLHHVSLPLAAVSVLERSSMVSIPAVLLPRVEIQPDDLSDVRPQSQELLYTIAGSILGGSAYHILSDLFFMLSWL
jgi:hypothetical protein